MRLRPRANSGRTALLVALPLAVVFLPPVAVHAGLPALSPFLGLSSVLAARAADVALLGMLPMLVLILWRRRFFCRFLCPVGWLTTLCGRVRPGARYTYGRVPRLGQWLALATIGGAVGACPFFLFLDPIAMFTGAAGAAAHWAYAIALASVMILSLALPGLWCARLCPLGGLQETAAGIKAWVLETTGRRGRDLEEDAGDSGHADRRAFFGVCGGLAMGLLISRRPSTAGEAPLRPPGAVGEDTMAALCVRCGSCVRACPSRIIHPDLRPPTLAGLLVPVVDFTDGHCLQDCARCGEACPTGAIAHLPIAEKNECRIGLASIDWNACLLTHEKECGVCVTVCPRQAIAGEFSKETYTVVLRVIGEQCNGCGACVAVCPARAIAVEPVKR